MKMVKVCVFLSDGSYTWVRADDAWLPPPRAAHYFETEVPEATVKLWEAAAELDRAVTTQLCEIINSRYNDAV